MGEIDTKPIEPVQVAITLFGEKSEHRKHRPTSSSSSSSNSNSGDEVDKEKDIEGLRKDLANYKVQLEAKDAAYLQLLHKLEHYQKTTEELSTQLKNTEIEKDLYLEDCKEANIRIDELEAKAKEMTDQILENGKSREQLLHVLGELKCVQGELLTMETLLAAATDDKLKALTQTAAMQASANIEKERSEELLKRVMELNEAILMSKQVALEAAKEEKTTETEDQNLRKQENELKLSDIEEKEKNSDKGTNYVEEMEKEMDQLKLELKNANDEVFRSNCEIEMSKNELEKVKTEMKELAERENGVQVEIALLKAELHKERAKLAAEARKGIECDQENYRKVTISQEEYENLIGKAGNKNENEILKKELESATAKVAEFRTRTEQAVTRAEAAERAKLALEDQLRKWREQKQRRKAALAALRQESLSREFGPSSSSYDRTPVNYQPLGKVLNMKF
ncbi:hypothetical protein JCGZ_11674 [Jatropha curcas]|uniref:Uncharacterized protein n=1 Tax=Jatropha curcas TaxID=180498 RepID=A0A067K8H4_JATCU|nr:putative WEB family protein At4g17210 [Jatropha curcas]KDP31298.1 hypothetical protein JCGZ_11674 [Jatropha curcas]